MVDENKSVVASAQAAGLLPAVQMKTQIESMFAPGRKGFEEKINPGEITLPRARMLQGTSEEVKSQPKVFYAGLIINSMTKEILTENFIPVRRLQNSWIRFNARKNEDPNFVPDIEPGGLVWRSDDPMDPRVIEQTKFGPKGEAPAATAYLNFLCYFEGFTLPCVLAFGRTSYQAGKDFFTMMLGAGGDMFSCKYKLVAKQETKKGNTYYVLEVTPAGKCTDDEVAIGNALYTAFGNVALKVHEEEAEPGSEG